MRELSKRRAKIVCTLGPSSERPDVLGRMIHAGLDVARLNFSHGSHADHTRVYETVRAAARKSGRIVAVLQDLQGPKLRLGKLPDSGMDLVAGDKVILFPEGADVRSSTKGRKQMPISAEIAEAIANDVKPGAKILMDDGKVITRVSQVSSGEILVEVEVGGHLTSRKGLNLPGTPLSLSATTDKDLKDLKLGLDLGVDAVALSFVRSPEDMEFVRKKIRKHSNARPLLIAKIEREEAVRAQDSIIEVSDGILIARGDMAVELGPERVPVIQKQLIHACSQVGVPIITATQMLESMISAPTPTRAEASDVANAVFDGTDAVMLSAETASGNYPVETVKMMAKIIIGAEKSRALYSSRPEVIPIPTRRSTVESIEFSASRIADHVGAVAIGCITHSGMAARTLAKYRPEKPIVAIMDSEESLRKLCFVWGVHGVTLPQIVPTDDAFKIVEDVIKTYSEINDGDLVVITAGIPTLGRGTTNMIKVHRIGVKETRKL